MAGLLKCPRLQGDFRDERSYSSRDINRNKKFTSGSESKV